VNFAEIRSADVNPIKATPLTGVAFFKVDGREQVGFQNREVEFDKPVILIIVFSGIAPEEAPGQRRL
jgi:hypothetical protein